MENTITEDGPDYPTPAEMKELLHSGAQRTLSLALAYCRKMEVLAPARAHAWRRQARSFVYNNPSPRPAPKR